LFDALKEGSMEYRFLKSTPEVSVRTRGSSRWRWRRFALGASMATLVLSVASAALGGPTVKDVSQLEERLEQLRQEVGVPAFSAAIAYRGRIVWAEGFGFADLERQIPAAPDTRYHLASLTKTFASTVILQLVQEGKIDLEAPVSRYGVMLAGQPGVLVKHLMSHTSAEPAGSAFRYDGNRYALLDTVIESASGRTFGQLVCERIIRPLALEHTAPNNQDARNFALAGHDLAEFERRMSRPYELDARGQIRPAKYPPQFSSSAGLISSVVDVAKFSLALDQGKLLEASTRARAFTRTVSTSGRTLPYGLGWFVTEFGGKKLVWHYGLWVANSSLIIKSPERELTFVVLANSDRLSKPYLLGIGALMTSPFARVFVESFVTGQGELPQTAIDE
jgi:CubicO group peptidase (beta-lactamase class C family)